MAGYYCISISVSPEDVNPIPPWIPCKNVIPTRVYFIAKEQNYIKINSIFGPKVSYTEQYLVPIFMD